MIKRINKIVALVLVTTTVATVAPTTLFSKIANAAENGQAEQINIGEQVNKVALATTISDYLKSEYPDCNSVQIGSEPVKTLNIPLTTSVAEKIVSSMITDEMVDEKAHDYVKAQLILAGIPNPSEELINSKVTDEVKAQVREKMITELANALIQSAENVPIYEYKAIDSDGKVIGKGYVVGGTIGNMLMSIGEPVYIDATGLDDSIIGKLIIEIKNKIQSLESNIDKTITGITDALEDLADATEDLSDSLDDNIDDIDDAWDNVFDRFDNEPGWGKKDGYVYYYDDDGVSLKGVQKIDGKTYYFNRIDGAMETGWQIVDGKRSYFDKKKGYQLTTQWIKDGDDWYFVDENGIVKKSSWIQDGGNTYYVKSDGKMTTGWLSIDEAWRYFNTNGVMVTSKWAWATDSWYYLKEDGSVATGWLQLGDKWYCFKDPSGEMETGWFRSDGDWYYSDNEGAMQTGWAYSSDGWCYLDDATGKMKKNEWVTVNGKNYYFNVNGIMVTGSRYIDGTKYTFNSDGSVQ